MRNLTESNLTDAVLAKLEGATDARFKQIMTSLIKHLHAFVREVELTEAEWLAGIQFLTATGQKCDDKRQEFILLSDTLGVSMLVDAINHRKPSGATESTVLGPVLRERRHRRCRSAPTSPKAFPASRPISRAACSSAGGKADRRCDARSVVDRRRRRVRRAAWRRQHAARARQDQNRCARDATHSGPSSRWAIRFPPMARSGKMLLRMGRHPYRPAHTHMIVTAPGHEPVTTHLFVEGDQYLESDAVFGVKDSLVEKFVRHEPGVAPDGKRMERPFYTVAARLRTGTAGIGYVSRKVP